MLLYYLSKLTECTTPGMNPINYGFGVIMICQHRYTNCNKCPTLVWVLLMQEAVHAVGVGRIYGNLCISLLISLQT